MLICEGAWPHLDIAAAGRTDSDRTQVPLRSWSLTLRNMTPITVVWY